LIEVGLKSESEDVFLTLDGQIGVSLEKGDVVEVKKSPHKTRLFIPCERDYFQVLREKLKWGNGEGYRYFSTRDALPVLRGTRF